MLGPNLRPGWTNPVKIAGVVVLCLIIAAIAIPAYQGYTVGSKASEGRGSPWALYWNVWAEDGFDEVPRYKPRDVIALDQEFTLQVQLAGRPYQEPNVASSAARTNLAEWLEGARGIQVNLEVLLIYDKTTIAPATEAERYKRIPIDIRKIEDWMRIQESAANGTEPNAYGSGVMAELRKAGVAAPYVFGSQAFRLRTMGRAGRSDIVLSIWVADGSGRKLPVDELHASVCIGTDSAGSSCGLGRTGLERTGVGVGLLDVAQPDAVAQVSPDAALTFVEVGKEIVALFRCNACGWDRDHIETWRLQRSAEEVVDYLSRTVLPKIDRASQDGTPSDLEAAGKALWNVLFKDADAVRSKRVESSVAEFVRIASQAVDTKPLRLHVRTIAWTTDNMSLLPVEFVSVPVEQNRRAFLGFSAIVERPLENQVYGKQFACDADWRVLLPPDTEEVSKSVLGDAKVAAGDWIQSLVSEKDGVEVYQDIQKFADWIGAEEEVVTSQATSGSARRVALVVLSHHENGELYFDQNTKLPSVDSASMTREFADGSVAILVACKTAYPREQGIMRQLNEKNIGAIVGTHVPVDGRVAGRFLGLFLEGLRSHTADDAYDLGRVRFEAVKKLAAEPRESPRGAVALGFMLAGDGRSQLCLPSELVRRAPGQI